MVTYVKLSKLTWTMEEGLIVKWLKKKGEEVKEGDKICEIETEKTTDTIEASASGVLREILFEEGTVVSVNQIIAVITAPEEEVPNLAELKQKAKEAVPKPLIAEKEKMEKEEKLTRKRKLKISPLARRLAEKHRIDISNIKGSGPGGRIVKKDVQEVLEEVKREEVIPVSGLRETVIKRLTLSARTALHVPITTEVDMTEVVKLRETLVSKLEEEGVRLTYTDILVKAVAEALKKHPIVNSRIEEGQIKLLKEINVGVAVALEEGLIVPVIRNADVTTIKEIACSRRDLV